MGFILFRIRPKSNTDLRLNREIVSHEDAEGIPWQPQRQ